MTKRKKNTLEATPREQIATAPNRPFRGERMTIAVPVPVPSIRSLLAFAEEGLQADRKRNRRTIYSPNEGDIEAVRDFLIIFRMTTMGDRTCPQCGGWDGGNHECPGTPNDRLDDLESDVAGLINREDEDRVNLLKALRRVAEYKNRSDRERELLIDLVEALETKA